jgi:hypothetical protein
LALLEAGERIVAPTWIVGALKAKWKLIRNLSESARRTKDRGENEQGFHQSLLRR